jgi:hypothetical protein
VDTVFDLYPDLAIDEASYSITSSGVYVVGLNMYAILETFLSGWYL